MREIQSSHDSAQSRVEGDVREELAEDTGVRNSDLGVQGAQGCRVQGPRGEQERHEIDISGSEAIWRDVRHKLVND